jgi:hypothetical protein
MHYLTKEYFKITGIVNATASNPHCVRQDE